jgi:hypothetical protein
MLSAGGAEASRSLVPAFVAGAGVDGDEQPIAARPADKQRIPMTESWFILTYLTIQVAD